VNGADTVFVRPSTCLRVFAHRTGTGHSDHFTTVKATDFKFDVSRDSPDMTPYFLEKGDVPYEVKTPERIWSQSNEWGILAQYVKYTIFAIYFPEPTWRSQ